MKRVVIALVGALAVGNLTAIDWVHQIYNGTDGTILVRGHTAVGGKGQPVTIRPGVWGELHMGLYCLTNLQVNGITGPIQGFEAWCPISAGQNVCTWHSFTVLQTGKKAYIEKSQQTGTGNVSIDIGANRAYDPDVSIAYQNKPYVLENGGLIVELTQ